MPLEIPHNPHSKTKFLHGLRIPSGVPGRLLVSVARTFTPSVEETQGLLLRLRRDLLLSRGKLAAALGCSEDTLRRCSARNRGKASQGSPTPLRRAVPRPVKGMSLIMSPAGRDSGAEDRQEGSKSRDKTRSSASGRERNRGGHSALERPLIERFTRSGGRAREGDHGITWASSRVTNP